MASRMKLSGMSVLDSTRIRLPLLTSLAMILAGLELKGALWNVAKQELAVLLEQVIAVIKGALHVQVSHSVILGMI